MHIGISLLVSAMFVSLMGIAQNYTVLLIFVIVSALGHALFHPAALILMSRLRTSGNRGRITAYFVVGGNLGYAIGPVLAGALIGWFGLPGLLLLIFPALFMVFALILTIPAFYIFFVSSGLLAICAILLFGFILWSTFAVAVAMSHELLPQNVGIASGVMLGFAIGFGGLGVAVNGMIADHYSLATALGTIPVPLIFAIILMIILQYPWKMSKHQFAVNADS